MSTDALELCNDALSEVGAATITSLTADSTKEDRLCNRFYAKVRDELLMLYSWNFAKKATPLNKTDLYNTDTGYDDYVTINSVSLTNPVVIWGANTYTAGNIVYIADVGGTVELNDLYFEVATPSTASFALLGVDGGKYTTFTTGGKVILAEPMTDYQSGYTYDIPTDCLRPLALESGLPFERIEDRILTTDEEPILTYTKKVTNTTKFPPLFEKCLRLKLAMTLCIPLLGAKEGSVIKERIGNDYQIALIEAARQEVNSILKDYTYTDTWITARK